VIGHNFSFTTSDVLGQGVGEMQVLDNSEEKVRYEIAILFLAVVLAGVATLLVACNKFWKHTLNYLKYKRDRKR
jgi:hypothetical protein